MFSPNVGKYGSENSEYGHFSRSACEFYSKIFLPALMTVIKFHQVGIMILKSVRRKKEVMNQVSHKIISYDKSPSWFIHP